MTVRHDVQALPDLLVCEHCDSVYARRPLRRGEVSRCTRCAAVLERAAWLDQQGWFALVLAAAVLLLLANVYPILHIRVGGQETAATLSDAVLALARSEAAVLALPAALAFIGIPLAQVLLLLWLLMHAVAGKRAPGFAESLRTLDALRPWSMAEVSLLGALIAITKLAGYLDVEPGAGLWALGGFVVLVTIVAGRDLRWLWQAQAPVLSPPPTRVREPRTAAQEPAG